MWSVIFVHNGLKHEKSHVWSVKSHLVKHLLGPFLVSLYHFRPLSCRVAAFTAEVHPDVAAERLVSDAVDEWTEQTRKHIGKQKDAEEDLGAILGPHGD